MPPTDSVHVRPVVPDDAVGVAGILNRVIETGAYSAFDTPFSVEAERDYILGLSARSVFLVAVRDADQRGRRPWRQRDCSRAA